MNTVIGKDLGNLSKGAVQTLKTFVANSKLKNIQNGNGALANPDSAAKMTEMLNKEIEGEFNQLESVGSGVDEGAKKVLDFESDTFRNSVANTLTEINGQVQLVVDEVDKLVEKTAD